MRSVHKTYTNYMTRKKLKTKRMDFHIQEKNFQKLLLLCNEERTFTEVINECIQGRYWYLYGTNELLTSIELEEKRKELEKKQIANINIWENN